MAYKPIIINAGQLAQLPAGQPLDLGGWLLPVSGGVLDRVLMADASGNAIWGLLPSPGLDINGLTGESAIASTDTLPFYDVTAGDNRKITFAELGTALGTSADEKVKVDAAATAGYLGVAAGDGVLRTSSLFTYTDGGDFVTLGIDESALTIANMSDAANYLLAGGSVNLIGNLSVDSLITIDGRDLSVDGAKLDGIETAADVTDATNVAAAGAAMSGGAFHDGFSDFVSDEHVAHTSIMLTAGIGLTGGGDISANRTIDLDIDSLTGESAIVSADTLAFYDATAVAHRKVTFTELGAALGVVDEMVKVDAAATAGYLGAASDDGVLRTSSLLTYTDGGNFITLGVDEASLTIANMSDAASYLLADGSVELTGSLAVTGGVTIDGRDLSVDGSKLDGIESAADVTDATNVAAAGAAMSGGAFHNGFSDFVADEHVAHTGITLTAGEGLTGGGTIADNRTFDLDINGLTGESAIVSADTLAFYDNTAGAHRKVTLTELGAALGSVDEMVKVDAAATAGYLGVAAGDGVLRTTAPLTCTDGGDFITLGCDALELIASDMTLYLETTGNDSTGDGSSGDPWKTLGKALTYLSDKSIATDATVTIQFGDGTHVSTATDIANHPNGGRIEIIGENIYALSLSSVQSSSGSSGAWSIVLNVSDVSNAAVNDFLLVPYDVSGGTRPETLCGCWKITNVDAGNTRLTVTSTHRHTSAPSGAISGTVTIAKTVLQYNGVSGIEVETVLGRLDRLVLSGNNNGKGLYAKSMSLTTGGPDLGINYFGLNLYVVNGAVVNFPYVKISNSGDDGGGVIGSGAVTVDSGSIYMYRAVISGGALKGIKVETNGIVGGKGPRGPRVISGHGGFGVLCATTSIAGLLDADITYNTTYGLYATYTSIIDVRGIGTITGNGTDYSPALNVEGNVNSYIIH